VGQEPEDEQDLQQRLGAAVGEPQPGDAGADLPQGGQIKQPFPDPEVPGVVDGSSVRNALPSLWYCLIAAYL